MIPKISLKQLCYFAAVAETGKVNAAASAIPVSASAVTEAIKHLERVVGTQLFERDKSGMHLTYDGYRLLDHARTIIRLSTAATEIFQQSVDPTRGVLHLSLTPAVSGFFLPRPYARFKRSFPDVKVELHEGTRQKIETDLRANAVELAVMLVSNLTLKRGVHVETLFRSHRAIWCAGHHPFATRETISAHDFADQTFILLALDEADTNISAYLNGQNITPAEIIRTQCTEAVRSLVAQGAGVTLLSDLLYRPWSLEGARIVSKPLVEAPPSMNLGMVWPESRPLSPLARLFADFLRREFLRSTAINHFVPYIE